MMATETTQTAQAPAEIIALIATAQRKAKSDLLTADDCSRAVFMYGEAVAYCSAHDLPLSSIRVLVGGGRKANSYRYSGETTYLSFDGSWKAYRGRAEKCAGGSGTYGSSYLLLEDLDKTRKLGGRKVSGSELGKVVVSKIDE